MDKLALVLHVFAFVCFCLATWPPAAPHWNRLVAAGLAFWVAVYIFTGSVRVFGG
jgi:hypothetical protein